MIRLDPNKWYFRAYVYIIGFLCIGPLVLPLAWINPRYDIKKKILVTLVTAIVTILISTVLAKSIDSIVKYYQMIYQLK